MRTSDTEKKLRDLMGVVIETNEDGSNANAEVECIVRQMMDTANNDAMPGDVNAPTAV